MEKINVSLGKRSYHIIITDKLFNHTSLVDIFWPLKSGDNVMLITNENISNLYLKKIITSLRSLNLKIDYIILPDGEKYKTIDTINYIVTALLQKKHGRDTTLIALGGGVIGDLTGFAAAIYQRGVRFIQIPTTLLAQVDASIGGKTSVNHILGKNMIGAFYQPTSVIINTTFLKSLPIREFSSGLAEVIKYSIILDNDFFQWIKKNINLLFSLNNQVLKYCISRCCRLKTSVVICDEYEKSYRSILNLGHTFGHAIESYMGYGKWLHGEAISAGMVMAAQTSINMNKMHHSNLDEIVHLLQCAKLPIHGPLEMKPGDYLPYIIRDKKMLTNNLRLIIPISIGSAEICTNLSHEMLFNAISDCNKKYN
ncbi:MAG: 3-dehydroquinate synthase [Pantoea sp. Brub]|nr:3-dehydroquinate synthase [Pantoea sp. Brub]